jgi:hypothetical protein
LLVFIPALLVILVWLWTLSPVPELDSATAEVLEASAEHWWRPDCPIRTIPQTDWPLKLRQLGPESVRVTPQGVFIVLGSLYVEEWGLFVLPSGSEHRPQTHSDPSFRLIRGRVYKYNIEG